MHENYIRNRERKLPFKMVLRKTLDHTYAFKFPRYGGVKENLLTESYSTERSAADVFKP